MKETLPVDKETEAKTITPTELSPQEKKAILKAKLIKKAVAKQLNTKIIKFIKK